MTADQRMYPSPFSEWTASQDTSCNCLLIHDTASDQQVKVEPPADWGRDWTWSVTEDGRGIHFRRTARTLPPDAHVFDMLSGKPGTVIRRVGPHEYEVQTEDGVEVWRSGDFQGG